MKKRRSNFHGLTKQSKIMFKKNQNEENENETENEIKEKEKKQTIKTFFLLNQ